MTNRPQVIAKFIPPPLGGWLTVDEEHKAVVRRRGRADYMFSGGSRKVEADAEIVVASLQPFRMDIGFGNCPESERVHARRPALHTLDGEEIGCMTAAIQFALVRDDRANVQRLLSVPRQSNEITVANLAADMDIRIHTKIRNVVAQAQRSRGRLLKADSKWITAIELGSQATVQGEFLKYGLSVESVHVNVVADAKDEKGSTFPPPETDTCNLEDSVDSENEPGDKPWRGETEITCVPPRFKSLHDAARLGETEIALRLIIAGAEINAKDGSGNTPLRVAILNHQTETAIALIAASANVHVRYKGNTLLHTAEWCDEIKVALALITAGADRNAQNWWRDTPLHSAVINGHIEAVRVLRDARANLNAMNKRGNTPLVEAINRGRTEFERALRDGIAPPPNMSLHDAAYRGETEIALRLIIAGVNVNHKNKHDATPLRSAIGNVQTETSLALIATGSDVCVSVFGYTLLHTAAMHGDTKVALALIAAGANVNAKGKNDWTPLHAAGADGHTKIALDLIRAGADIHAMDYDGNTPLHVADINGYIKTKDEMIAAAQRR